jgi:hypothetical protein
VKRPDATFALKLYARRRRAQLAAMDPVAQQEATLFDLLKRAETTDFGQDHGFDRIRRVADYQNQVPLRRWDQFWASYWKDPFPVLENVTWPGRIPYFAVTSGTTTGRTKHIPISREMLASNRQAALDTLTYHLVRRPHSKVWGGPNFMLGGSTDLKRLTGGAMTGDISGIAAAEMPWYARPLAYPPTAIALIPDWPTKLDRLVADAAGRDVRLLSGTPSWLLVLIDRLLATTGKDSLGALYPHMELLLHGGVSFAPYRQRFELLLAGCEAELAEVYPASEGFIATQDATPEMGLRLMIGTGLFYEFVPVAELDADRPTRHWLADVQTGVDYAIVLTTCAGLWSYVLGDTVRFVSVKPPRLQVTGRTGWSLSVFGEHLIAREVESAVAVAAATTGLMPTDWTMGAVLPMESGALGYHHLIVELPRRPATADLQRFADMLDEELCRQNEDYEAHRAEGIGLSPPRVSPVPPGTFARWMAAQGKEGGQHKVPRLIGDASQFADAAAGLLGR